MSTKQIEHSAGWFVLLWDDEYNGQHLGGKLVLKTPVEFWDCDPSGEEPPVPYGYPQETQWSELNKRICGNDETRLVSLAFDALLAPNGEVIVIGSPSFDSVEKWLEAVGLPSEYVDVEIIDARGTKARPGVVGSRTGHEFAAEMGRVDDNVEGASHRAGKRDPNGTPARKRPSHVRLLRDPDEPAT